MGWAATTNALLWLFFGKLRGNTAEIQKQRMKERLQVKIAISSDSQVSSWRDWLQPSHSRASAGLTAIDAGIAGSAGLHQAATGHAGRSVPDVIEEL